MDGFKVICYYDLWSIIKLCFIKKLSLVQYSNEF